MSAKHPKRKDRPGVDRAGRTPLHYAAVDADLGSVQRLLAVGMDPNAQDDEGWTPLHFAAQSNSVEITELLLKAGASVDACDSHGNTPLFRAVFNSRGNGDVIRLLRGSGANPYTENKHGVSSPKLARTIANYDIRQFFVDLPEDTNG